MILPSSLHHNKKPQFLLPFFFKQSHHLPFNTSSPSNSFIHLPPILSRSLQSFYLIICSKTLIFFLNTYNSLFKIVISPLFTISSNLWHQVDFNDPFPQFPFSNISTLPRDTKWNSWGYNGSTSNHTVDFVDLTQWKISFQYWIIWNTNRYYRTRL